MTRLLNGEYIQRGCASFDTPSYYRAGALCVILTILSWVRMVLRPLREKIKRGLVHLK